MSIIEKAIEKKNKEKSVEKETEKSKAENNKTVETKPEIIDRAVETNAATTDNEVSKSIKLDFSALRQAGMFVPDNTNSRIENEYRVIKRPLIMNASGKGASIVDNANLIVVTSSLPGEGKTFSAVNLAMSIAMERDKHVLLVDADVARSSISKLLHLDEKSGLIDMLVDEHVDFSDVVIKTDLPNLSILPSGRTHPHSTELLASNEMAAFTTELSKRYSDRIVIFDAPPLLVTTEASVLANHMGQVVMVVEAGKTQQSQVKEALARLNSPEIIGFILNKTIGGVMGGEYDYSYGYYGSGEAS